MSSSAIAIILSIGLIISSLAYLMVNRGGQVPSGRFVSVSFEKTGILLSVLLAGMVTLLWILPDFRQFMSLSVETRMSLTVAVLVSLGVQVLPFKLKEKRSFERISSLAT